MNGATTTESNVVTYRSGDEWVRFSEGQSAVTIDTSDGEHSEVSPTEAIERKAWTTTWGYRIAA